MANGSAPGYAERFWRSRDGLSLYARDYGPGGGDIRCPVICLHGLTRNSGDFDDLAPLIAAQGRRVLALDMRGRGKSEWDSKPERYAPWTYTGDVLELLDQAGISRAVFIGTSMGGIIMLALALRRRAIFAAAVLNDTGPIIGHAGIVRISAYLDKGPPVISSWEDAANYQRSINGAAFPANTPEEWLRWAKRSYRQQPDGSFGPNWDPAIANVIKSGKAKARPWIAKWMFRRLARAVPTLVIRGSTSDILDQSGIAYMRRVAPTMSYVEVPGIGHAPMMTEPAALAGLSEFLARVP